MFSFVSDWFGPIFAKELVEVARRLRYYLARGLVGLVLLFVLWTMYESFSYNIYRSGMTTGEMARIGDAFFSVMVSVQFAMVFFFVPMFLSGVISSERENKTLDLLFTTQLQSREIIFGKLASRVFTMLMLLVIAIPVLFIIAMMGGVDSMMVLRVAWVTFLGIAMAGSLSIYFSTTTRSPLGSMIRSYWWLGLLLLLIPYATIFLCMFAAGFSPQLASFLVSLVGLFDPIFLFFGVVLREGRNSFTAILGPYYVLWCSIFPLLFSAFFFWRSVVMIRRDLPPRKPSRLLRLLTFPFRKWKELQAKSATGGLSSFIQFFTIRRIIYIVCSVLGLISLLASFQTGRHGDLRIEFGYWIVIVLLALVMLITRFLKDPPQDGTERAFRFFPIENPLWFRARKAWVYDREGHIRRIIWGCYALLIGYFVMLGMMSSYEYRDGVIGGQFVVYIGVMALIVLISGFSFQSERNRGMLEIMLVSPMKPSEFIWGFFVSIWRHVKRLLWLAIPFIIMMVIDRMGPKSNNPRYYDSSQVSGVIVSVYIALLNMVLLTVHCLGASIAARSIAGALVGGVLYPIFFLIITAFIFGMARQDNGSVFAFLIAVMLPITLIWNYFRKSVGSFVCLSIFLTMTLVLLFTFHIVEDNRYMFPGVFLNPGFMTASPLFERDWFDTRGAEGIVLFWYTLAILLNIFLLLLWIWRNFDELSGRAVFRKRAMEKAKQAYLNKQNIPTKPAPPRLVEDERA